jgi:hypothetical protein
MEVYETTRSVYYESPMAYVGPVLAMHEWWWWPVLGRERAGLRDALLGQVSSPLSPLPETFSVSPSLAHSSPYLISPNPSEYVHTYGMSTE